ncbi:MAG: glycosyltransferase, partial [Candidatus Omnitrophica bacterium]|nr:glycosyltransferase [Candidatus Omnitrophota bacterium]
GRPAWLPEEALGAFGGMMGCVDYGPARFTATTTRPCPWGGGNMAIRRDVLTQLGGFDVRMTRAQDTEYYQRVVQAGFTVCYEPSAAAHHVIPAERSTPAFFRQWRRKAGYYSAYLVPWKPLHLLTLMPLWRYGKLLGLCRVWLAKTLTRQPWWERFYYELLVRQELSLWRSRLAMWPLQARAWFVESRRVLPPSGPRRPSWPRADQACGRGLAEARSVLVERPAGRGLPSGVTRLDDHAQATGRRTVRVACLPAWFEPNPYLRLFYEALKPHGIELVVPPEFDPSTRATASAGGPCSGSSRARPQAEPRDDVDWLLARRHEIDVVHFHWINGYYRKPTRLGSLRGAIGFVRRVRRLRRAGFRIVWTCHNLWPHEPAWKPAEFLARAALARLADAILVHYHFAADRVRRMYRLGKTPVAVIGHGSYLGVYPDTRGRAEARARLQLPPDAFVFLAFGHVRGYKGLEDIVRAYRQLADQDAVLVIAGRPLGRAEQQALDRLIGDDPGIRLHVRDISNEDVQDYFHAADAAVFAGGPQLASGSLLLALSFGVPVIYPESPLSRELLTADVGVRYQAGTLADAMARVRRADRLQLAANARQLVRALTWEGVGRAAAPWIRGERP